MPRLWNETIETHRSAVRDATLDAAADVIGRRGLAAATMTEIAECAGIGRATLYKYFPDVESIVTAWHERQVSLHLAELAGARDTAAAGRQLEAVLETYARHQRDRAGSPLASILHARPAPQHGGNHREGHLAMARQHLTDLLADLISSRQEAGTVRADIPATELAIYCLHALSSAEELTSNAAIRRLSTVVLTGIAT